MGFSDRYVHAMGASNLMDDEKHHSAEPLAASGLAVVEPGGISDSLGPLLNRVRYRDGVPHKLHEGNAANLAQLLRLWTEEVIKRGRARRWVPENTAWDAQAANKLYRDVAEISLAYWLDGKCPSCHGSTVDEHRRTCRACMGSGEAPIAATGGYLRERVRDMVSELHAIMTSHAGRANNRLRGE